MKSTKKKVYVAPLYEGTFSVGLDKKFNRIDRDDPPAKRSLKLAINPFLISAGGRNILLDAGLGEFGEGTSTDTIRKNLETHGLNEYDITDIFTSHLHYDHLGGLARRANGYLELTFPDAKLWVNRNEWKKLLDAGGATDDETRIDFIHFLEARADLHFLESEDQPYPEIRTREIGGHTEFSQLLTYEDGEEKYLMAGDVIGRKLAVRKKFTAKFDYDPKATMEVREELKKRAFEEGYILMAYHEPHTPLMRLTGHDPSRGYTIEDADETDPN